MVSAVACASVGEIQRSRSNFSRFRSTAEISGSTAVPNRSGSDSFAYRPLSAFAQVSIDGVAEASTATAPANEARSTAMSRAW